MSAVCPECAQGKHDNCTGEAMEGEVLMECQCKVEDHDRRIVEARRVFGFLDGMGQQGATVREIQHALGQAGPRSVPRPGGVLLDLAREGRAVRLSEEREGWAVWVTADNVAGRQIAVDEPENNTDEQEGTDMNDEVTPEETDADVLAFTRAMESGKVKAVRVIPIMPEGPDEGPLNAEQDARCNALYHAKSILGLSEGPKGPLQGSSKTPPPASELIKLAAYIVAAAR